MTYHLPPQESIEAVQDRCERGSRIDSDLTSVSCQFHVRATVAQEAVPEPPIILCPARASLNLSVSGSMLGMDGKCH